MIVLGDKIVLNSERVVHGTSHMTKTLWRLFFSQHNFASQEHTIYYSPQVARSQTVFHHGRVTTRRCRTYW